MAIGLDSLNRKISQRALDKNSKTESAANDSFANPRSRTTRPWSALHASASRLAPRPQRRFSSSADAHLNNEWLSCSHSILYFELEGATPLSRAHVFLMKLESNLRHTLWTFVPCVARRIDHLLGSED